MKLYELPAAWADIEAQIDQADGEMPPAVEEALDALTHCLESKVEGICMIVRQMEGEADFYQKEALRLQDRAAYRHRNARRLKEYLRRNLELLKQHKVVTPRFTVTLCNNGRPSISYDGLASELPETMRVTRVELDGAAAYEQWKKDGELPAGFTVKLGNHIRIS